MKKFNTKYLWGTLLIVLGILFLLQEFDLIGSAWDLLWAIIMGVAGIVFLWVFATNENQWWAAIPGMTLLGLSAVVLGSMESIPLNDDWMGSLFLAFIGIGFWLVYIRQTTFWWAIIPGGTLITLGAVSGFDSINVPSEGVFFLGLGITFALLGLLPAKQHSTQWAYIPAAVLGVLGLAQLTAMGTLLANFWPVILILIGGFIIIKNLK